MAGPSDLHATAVEVKDACVALLAETSGGAVDFAFVSPGEPALDCCPALFVHVSAVGEADTIAVNPLSAGLRHRTGRSNLATLLVTFVRCVPADDPVDVVALEAAAAQTNEDAWMLWTQLYRQQQDGTLFGLCETVFFDGISPLSIQGGCAGWVMQIRIELPGFRLEGS